MMTRATPIEGNHHKNHIASTHFGSWSSIPVEILRIFVATQDSEAQSATSKAWTHCGGWCRSWCSESLWTNSFLDHWSRNNEDDEDGKVGKVWCYGFFAVFLHVWRWWRRFYPYICMFRVVFFSQIIMFIAKGEGFQYSHIFPIARYALCLETPLNWVWKPTRQVSEMTRKNGKGPSESDVFCLEWLTDQYL